MSCHVIFSVEFLGADSARIRFSVQMCCDIVPVEVGGVRVRVVTHLASVSVPLLETVTANADGVGGVVKAETPGSGGSW